jgi:hypothetical protein
MDTSITKEQLTSFLNEFHIEFRTSSTGSYSPWHLDIAKRHNVPLMGTCDTGYFFKLDDEVYQTDMRGYIDFQEYLIVLDEMYIRNEITKEDILTEINEIIDGRNDAFDIYVRPCEDLKHFEQYFLS